MNIITNSPYFWYTMFGLYLFSTLWVWVKAYKIKRLKYAVKVSINSLRWLAHLIWACYFFIGGCVVMSTIENWVNQRIVVASPDTPLWVYNLVPFVWFITIIVVVVWVITKGFQPLIKYTDSEKEWLKEGRLKMREKLPKYLKWFYK